MDVQPPLNPIQDEKVSITTTTDTASPIIVLALASPSYYVKRTRTRSIRDPTLVPNCSSGKQTKCSKRKRKDENGCGVRHDDGGGGVRVVSPYFGYKEGEKVGNGNVIVGKKKKKDDEMGSVGNKGKRRGKMMGSTNKEISVVGKRKKDDGTCYVMAKGEVHDEKSTAHEQEDGVCNMIVKHKKKRKRKVLPGVTADFDMRVVSPYFVKGCSGHKGPEGDIIDGKQKRVRKKRVRKGQSHQEFEIDGDPQKVVSPCFRKQSGGDQGTSQIQHICKGTGKKSKKQRSSTKRTCDGEYVAMENENKVKKCRDGEYVELEDEMKVKKCRDGNNKTHDKEQLLQEEKDVNKALILEPLDSFPLGSYEKQDGVNCRIVATDVDVEVGSSKNDIKEDCAIYGEPEKHAPPSFRDVKRRRVKPGSSRRSKVNKNQDAVDGGQGEPDVAIKCISKKKMKATLSKSCTHEIEGCQHVSKTRKTSSYFQKESQKEGHENKITSTCTNFEELLSRCAYRYESKVKREVGIVNDEVDNSNENGSVVNPKRKQHASRSKPLTAAEKKSEAYQRKTPCNTWIPPHSPYHLLQEHHAHDPWRVLVICMLLNQTTGSQVKQVLSAFFSICPNAEAAVSVDPTEIQRVIQSLGLHRKRAASIQRLSKEYLSESWTHVTQLHGIGKYAADAYAIFVNGMWDQVTPNDHMLNYYWKYLKNHCKL